MFEQGLLFLCRGLIAHDPYYLKSYANPKVSDSLQFVESIREAVAD